MGSSEKRLMPRGLVVWLTTVASDNIARPVPVEGQVNRLKMLKRQMYGRAGVELLRAQLIPLPMDLTTVQRE
jgi:hypothetical protein